MSFGIYMAFAIGAILLSASSIAIGQYRRDIRRLRHDVQRLTAEEARFHEGGMRYSALFDTAPVGCVVWEPGFVIIDWNRKAEKIFGWSRGEVLGRNLIDTLVLEKDRSEVLQQSVPLFANGQAHHTTLQHVTRNGAAIACEWHHAVLRDADGTPTRGISLCVDVTDHQALNRTLRTRERYQRTLLDNFPFMVWLKDTESRFLAGNQALAAAAGTASPEALIGKTDLDYFPAELAETYRADDREVMRSGLRKLIEEQIEVGGERRWLETSKAPVTDTDGHLLGTVGYGRDITERKQHEAQRLELQIEAARAKEGQRYREVFDNASDAIFILDAEDDGRLVLASINPAAEQAFGWPSARLQGLRLDEIARDQLGADTGQALAESLAHVRACFATGMPASYEGRLELRPGPENDVYQITLIPLAGDRGIVRIIGIANNITQRKRYEQALLDRVALEERLTQLATHVPGLLYVVKLDASRRLSVPYVSDGVRRLYGISPAEAMADIRATASRNHPDDQARIRHATLESARSMTPMHIEHRVLPGDGRTLWVETQAQPTRTEDGGVLWHGVSIDITERRAMEERLHVSERELRTLMDNIPDLVLRYDRDCLRVYANSAWERATGTKREDIVGTLPAGLGGRPLQEPTPTYVKLLESVIASGESREFELQWPMRDGSMHWYHHRLVAESDKAGRVIGAVVISNDITERKRIESTLRFIADPDGGGDLLAALARHLGRALGVEYVVVDRLTEAGGEAETVALYARGEIAPNMRYPLQGTPCDNVAGKRGCCYPRDVQKLFPHDPLLVDMGVDSYAGIPLWDSNGQPLGLIAVMGCAPFQDEAAVLRVLQLAAPRAAAELERAQSDAKLRVREQEFRTLAENSPDPIVRYDLGGRRLYANPAFENFSGIPAREAVGKTVAELSAMPDSGSYQERLMAAARGERCSIEVVAHTPHGRRTYHMRLVPERSPNGAVTGVLAIGHDITEIKDAQAHMSRFIANAPGFVYTMRRDAAGHVSLPFVSPGFEAKFGVAPDTVCVDIAPLRAVYHPDDRARVQAAFGASAAQLTPVCVEFRAYHPENGEFWIESRATPMPQADGEIHWYGFGLDISERKRIEAALRAREREFRTLTENLPDPVYRFDRECRRVYVNPAAARITGTPVEELLGSTPADARVVKPEFAEKALAEIRAVFETVQRSSFDVEYVTANGSPREFNMLLVPEFGADGRVASVLGLAHEITSLREAERRLAHFINTFPAFAYSFRVAPDGYASFPFASPGIERLLGLKPEDVKDDAAPLLRLAHPDDWPRIKAAFADSARTMRPFHDETRVCRPDQPERWVEMRSTPVRETDGSIVWYGLTIDVTERKRVEAALAAREHEFSSLVNNLPNSIARWDRGGRYLYVNPSFEHLRGKPAALVIGKRIDEVISDADASASVVAGMAQVVETGAPVFIAQLPVTGRNGEPQIHELLLTPEKDSRGEVMSVLGVGQDITKRLRYEAVLLLRAKLEEQISSVARSVPGFLFTIRIEADGHTHFPFASAGIEELFGLRPEDIHDDAAALRARYHPDDLPRLFEAIAASKETLAPFRLEMRATHPAKGPLWIEIRSLPHRQGDGAVEWHGLMIEITERKRIETALALREQEFRTLAENLPVAVIRYDAEQRRRYLNRAAERMLHGSAAELLGHVPGGPTVPATPAMIDHYRGEMDKVLATDTARELDFVLDALPADRREHYEIRFVPEHDADGQTTGVLAIWYDITALKDSETRYRTSSHLLRAILESSPDVISFALDRDYRYLAFNAKHRNAMRTIWGQDIAVGTAMLDLMGNHPDRETARQSFDRALAGNSFALEQAFGDERLTRRYWQNSYAPIRAESGDVVGLTCFCLDISQRRRIEEELQRREQYQRTLLDNSPYFVWLKDRDSRLLAANNQYARVAKVASTRDLEGKTDFDFFPRDLAEKYVADDQGVMSSGQTMNVVEMYADENDERHWMETWKSPLVVNGEIVGTVGCSRDITERKQMQEQMLQALEFTEGVINAIPDVLLEMDGEGRYLNVWAQKQESLAAQREALIGRTVHEVLAPEAAAVVMAAIREADASGFSFGQIIHIELPQGAGWFEMSIAKKAGSAPSTPRFIMLSRDVTERKALEKELRRREEEFRAAVENAPDPIFRYDREGRRLYANKAILELTQQTSSSLLGATPADGRLVSPVNAEKILGSVRAVVETRQESQCEVEFITPDGGRNIFQNRYVPEFGPDGEVATVLSISRDITLLRESLEALNAKEVRLAEAQRVARLGSWELDLRTDNLRWSEEIFRIFEIDPATFGASYEAFLAAVHPDDRDAVNAAYRHSLESRAPYEFEHRLLMPDGRIKYVHERGESHYGADGVPMRSFGTVQDITDSRKAQDMLDQSRALQRELLIHREEAVEEERKRIARELHEELGQVLTALRMNLSMLRVRHGESMPLLLEKTQTMIGLVDRAIGSMREVVTTLRPSILDAGIVAALEWLTSDFEKHTGIECCLSVADPVELPDECATALFRIVQEALTNAARHAEATRTEIWLEYDGEQGQVCIRDNGKGFDTAETFPRNFGLLGMRERARVLNGELEISSARQHGTLIRLRFPCCRPDPTETA